MHRINLIYFVLISAFASQSLLAKEPLRISVYATAGGILQHLATASGRERAIQQLKSLQVTRIFLEGRRGDEYVPPAMLREVREFLKQHGIETTGGIATVPGSAFGVRQNEGLGWLNWEHPKTRSDISAFFTENAPVFDEIIVDDFYCTGDRSVASQEAKGNRSWSEYRADLLVSSIQPLIIEPARKNNPSISLIIKYPQWYDRFHLFGYAPHRSAPFFNKVWVGTEVRNPQTQRMGFVQPTEGYMNFRWISSVVGTKVEGAWFDHIECTPQNFVDQAYQSVLAGAQELTLFHLGDLIDGHPGDALLAKKLPELFSLAEKISAQKSRIGMAFYKPPGSDAADNLYLMDYLGMIGFPILPEAHFPKKSSVIFLGAQAAADTRIMDSMRGYLSKGGCIVMTPAFLRLTSHEARELAGVSLGQTCVPGSADRIQINTNRVLLNKPVELDASLALTEAKIKQQAQTKTGPVPFLTQRFADNGVIFVLNVRTFDEADFRAVGEWLLCPKTRGISELPEQVLDPLRQCMLERLKIQFDAPAGVGLYLFESAQCLYNFRDDATIVRLNGQTRELARHELHWMP